MNKLLLEIVGGWVRAALIAVSTYLVSKKIVTADQGVALVNEAFTYFLQSVPGLIALGWTIWAKVKSRSKLLTGLTLPVGSTENDVIAKIKSGSATPTVTTPPDTAPGVPGPANLTRPPWPKQ